jgi:glutamate racemase
MGGLTVLRALRARLPEADFIYLGDTARLPYGTKSGSTVTQYALQSARALIEREIGLLVIACNTASAVALPALTEAFAPLPVIGVVEPGAEAGVAATRNGHIAVIATESTVRGGAYIRAIQARNPDLRVTQAACPLFVALAEEGWTEGEVTLATARRYLEPLFAGLEPPDTLVLGCTHFPVLRQTIAAVAGPGVTIVDSAETTAGQVAALLNRRPRAGGDPGAARSEPVALDPRLRGDDGGVGGKGRTQFLVTDSPERFARVGSSFLDESIDPATVELIDLSLSAAFEILASLPIDEDIKDTRPPEEREGL